MKSNQRRGELGQTIVEFVIALLIFISFISGLFTVAFWGLGGQFAQNAIHEGVRKYSVTLDNTSASSVTRYHLGRLAYVFIKPETVQITISHDETKARGTIIAEPRIKHLYLYSMPDLRRESSCTLEYHFRNPTEFKW